MGLSDEDVFAPTNTRAMCPCRFPLPHGHRKAGDNVDADVESAEVGHGDGDWKPTSVCQIRSNVVRILAAYRVVVFLHFYGAIILMARH